MVSPGWTRDVSSIQPVRFMIRTLGTSEKIRSSRTPWPSRIRKLVSRFLARLVARKHTFEHLRYEFLGRNSYTDQRPHPHSGCVVSIRETGRVEPFPNDFEEGKGYMPPER